MKKKEGTPEKQYLDECLSYDESTGVFTWKKRPVHHFINTRYYKAWNTRFSGKKTGYLDTRGHIQIKLDGIKYSAHNLAYIMMTGCCPEFIDHIDQNKINNRFDNLRPCTTSQNKANTSGYKGVYLMKSGRWRAQICKDYKIKHLGSFDTKEEAEQIYRSKHVELFGEFSVHNAARERGSNR